MMTSLGTLVRGTLLMLALACGLAVSTARLMPRPAGFRLWQVPRHAAINGGFFAPTHSPTEVFNTETGRFVTFRLPDGEALQWAGFSDWVDDEGESQVVGRWTSRAGNHGDATLEDVGLGRFSFPSGRALDRVRLEKAPVSLPCWYPGSTSRVLYASADGGLYRYEFKGRSVYDSAPIDDRALPITWSKLPPGVVDVFVEDPFWPADDCLKDCLLATVSFKIQSRRGVKYQPHQIWWLRLDATGTTVVDSGRLSSDGRNGGESGDSDADERYPRMRPSTDGELILAYQVRREKRNASELRVARVELDPKTGVPVMRHADSRKLLEGCAIVPPIFTPTGDGLFTLVHNPQGLATLERVPFSESLLPQASRSLARRPLAPRSLTYRVPGTAVPKHPG
ncbi:MAG: hypothetical protein P4L84_13545 [Isosphaeraceae bacterium]|nr:hypothetical protein [Isosphaeraceae bacterium]